MEFLNNEDVKQMYVYLKPQNQMIASRVCVNEANVDKGILFLKLSNASKLTADQMSKFDEAKASQLKKTIC